MGPIDACCLLLLEESALYLGQIAMAFDILPFAEAAHSSSVGVTTAEPLVRGADDANRSALLAREPGALLSDRGIIKGSLLPPGETVFPELAWPTGSNVGWESMRLNMVLERTEGRWLEDLASLALFGS